MKATACGLTLALLLPALQGIAQNDSDGHSGTAPLSSYLMPRDAEISLARSAAPESISRDAGILVLTSSGYQRAVKGKNGFVCMVSRSWFAAFGDPDFWNPRVRAPICYNALAALSQVPEAIKRTQIALAGGSESQIRAALAAATKSGELPVAKAGALAYMMSKGTYFNHRTTHWRPHLMFFVPETDPKSWGAGLARSPILGVDNPEERLTVFLIPLGRWSDGSLSRAR